MQHSHQQIDHYLSRCHAANPALKMKQGYSICRDEKTKTVINSINRLKCNTYIQTEFSDGCILSQITEVSPNEKPIPKHTNKRNQ